MALAAPAGALLAQTSDGDAMTRWRERVAAGKAFVAQAKVHDERAKALIAAGKPLEACDDQLGYIDQYRQLLAVTRDLEKINNEAHLVDDKEMQKAIQGKLDSITVTTNWYNAHCTAAGRAALEVLKPDPQAEYASLVKRIDTYVRNGNSRTRLAMQEAGIAMTDEQFESANGQSANRAFGSSGHRFAACAEADTARKEYHNAELLIDYALKYGQDHGIDTTALAPAKAAVERSIGITRNAC
jgi:hypothetical protein